MQFCLMWHIYSLDVNMALQRKLLRYENQFIVPFHHIKEFITNSY